MRLKKRTAKQLLTELAKCGGIAAAISGVLSWYLTSFLCFLIYAHKLIYNPLDFFKYYRSYGFPVKWFAVAFFVGFVFCTLALYMSRRKKYDEDERNFKYSESGVYGTARLLEEADMQDLALVQPPDEAMGTILAQMDQTGDRIVNQRDKTRINKHICVFGASQSGKTFSFVLPFCLQAARRRESLVVTDPKGELYETTAEYFRSQGYVVRCLNLKDPQRSDGWDCMKELFVSDLDPDQRAQIFANIVVSNVGGGKDSGDIHTAAPELLLTAMLLRFGLDDSMRKSGTNNFRELLGAFEHPDGVTYIDSILFGDNAPPEVDCACRTYRRFKMASDNLYGNIIVGLATKLNPLTSEVIKEVISKDDIDLTLPGKKPCVYYCIMSDMHGALNFISALFFSFLFLDLAEFADKQPDKRCPVPVNFLLDEFANCGSIPDFDKKIAVVRSRAMNISIILQDINQLKNRYPKTWQSIMSNCATHLCIGFNDPDTEAYYSDRTGDTTVKVMTKQHEKVEPIFDLGHKHSTGDGRRAVLDRSELARLSLDECLVVFQSKNALRAYKYPVSAHPDYPKLKQCSISDIPSIMDHEAREHMRAEEEQRIARFEKWLAEGGDPFPYLKRPGRKSKSPRKEKKKLRHKKDAAAAASAELPEEEILDLDALEAAVPDQGGSDYESDDAENSPGPSEADLTEDAPPFDDDPEYDSYNPQFDSDGDEDTEMDF